MSPQGWSPILEHQEARRAGLSGPLWRDAHANDERDPNIQTASAAVITVAKGSPLSVLISQEPSANWAPVRNRIMPTMLLGKRRKKVAIELLKEHRDDRRITREPLVRALNRT